jgi:hypothetical protein
VFLCVSVGYFVTVEVCIWRDNICEPCLIIYANMIFVFFFHRPPAERARICGSKTENSRRSTQPRRATTNSI